MAQKKQKETAPATKKETSTENTGQAKPVKKSHTCLIILIVVIVLLAVLGVGGFFVSKFLFKKAGEGLVERTIEKITGGKVNLSKDGASINTKEGSLSIGSSVKWPSDMPSDVPEFTDGKLNLATKESTAPRSWIVIASEVTAAEFAKYKNQIKALGWKENTSTSFGADLIQYSKGNLKLTLTYDGSSNGLDITVSYKN